MSLTTEQVISQSKTALRQWGEAWEKHCRHVAEKHPVAVKRDLKPFANSGIGKALLLIANGASFEREIETIKSLQDNVDIMVCDQTLGHSLQNGVIPKFCLVADAHVSYESYMEPWKDKLQNTILFHNVCGNPKWIDNGNWADRYCYINMDSIHSEKKWQELTGCPNLIAAGTNVSNAMVIFATQSTNTLRQNFFGYDKILLVGFDYSWQHGNYYAFDSDAGGKTHYMRHQYLRDLSGKLAFSSNNLIFSAQWLAQYVKNFKLPVVQCSGSTVFVPAKTGVLKEQMRYSYIKADAGIVQNLVSLREKAAEQIRKYDKVLARISKEHHFAAMRV